MFRDPDRYSVKSGGGCLMLFGLPFFVALGAAGEGAVGERIHHSVEYGGLVMDAYSFASA